MKIKYMNLSISILDIIFLLFDIYFNNIPGIIIFSILTPIMIFVTVLSFKDDKEVKKAESGYLYDIPILDGPYVVVFDGNKFWSRELVEINIDKLYDYNEKIGFKDYENRKTMSLTQRNLVHRDWSDADYIKIIENEVMDSIEFGFYSVLQLEVKDKIIIGVKQRLGNQCYMPELNRKLLGLKIEG